MAVRQATMGPHLNFVCSYCRIGRSATEPITQFDKMNLEYDVVNDFMHPKN